MHTEPSRGQEEGHPQDDSWDAVILHIDMDAFFLSVELLDAPQLAGVPALVAHHSPRSVVLSASYEARAFGIRSAMPLAHAKALCPQVLVLQPHSHKYSAASAHVMKILKTVTPWVEQLSIDEAFLDVSGARRRLGSPAHIAKLIKQQIADQVGLPSTVGVAATKSVAKIVSTRSKPDGLGVVPADRTREYLNPLPVSTIWGVGPKMAERLEIAGISTVADLASQSPQKMQRWLGAVGSSLVALARGIDPRPVVPSREAKSVGAEKTFDDDVTDVQLLHSSLLDLSYECARRLRADGLQASTISVKVKDPQRQVRTRSLTLEEPTSSGALVAAEAKQLLGFLLEQRHHPVRLLGVRAEKLSESAGAENVQETLFSTSASTEAAQRGKTDQIVDDIAKKFPSALLKPATLLNYKPRQRPRD